MLKQVEDGTATIEEAEKYKGILRLEIQHKSPKIYNENAKFENSDDFKKGTRKCIDDWWSIEAMEKHYFEQLEEYLYRSDYYKRKICKKLVDESKELNTKWKKILNKFSLLEDRYTMDGIVKKKIKCEDTIKDYIKRLNKLDINPVTISAESQYDRLESLVKLARRTAEEKYFK